MFLQVSVILFTGGAGPRGSLAWGEPGPGGYLVPGGRGAWWRPPPQMATAARGTHPTGMHSCGGYFYQNMRVFHKLSAIQ